MYNTTEPMLISDDFRGKSKADPHPAGAKRAVKRASVDICFRITDFSFFYNRQKFVAANSATPQNSVAMHPTPINFISAHTPTSLINSM
jgi:hypothetical protein